MGKKIYFKSKTTINKNKSYIISQVANNKAYKLRKYLNNIYFTSLPAYRKQNLNEVKQLKDRGLYFPFYWENYFSKALLKPVAISNLKI
jgi:hypothetical protein